MPQSDFTSVGFFHFGKDYEHPVQALKEAIEEFKTNGGMLKDALIVLPEGFNLGRYYGDDDDTANFDVGILCELAAVSESVGCAFVAGLIIADTPDIHPPYSSGYFIDGDQPIRLLTRKTLGDHTASPSPHRNYCNYTPLYGSFKSDFVVYRGVTIAALICRDAMDWRSYYHNDDQFMASFQSTDTAFRVMCIPANTERYFSKEATIGTKVADGLAWVRTVNVFANSHKNHLSFVSGLDGEIITSDAKGPVNCIRTVALEALRVQL